MKLEELARQYIGLNVFNVETGDFVMTATKLFIERAGISECSEIDIDALIRFKTATLKTAKPVTYNSYLNYMRILGDYAVENNHLKSNLFRTVKMARIGSSPPKTLSDENLLRALEYLESENNPYRPVWFWRQVIMVLYYTGIRRRQLVFLLRSDVDLVNGVLKLRYESSKTRREWDIPIHRELAIELKAFIEQIEVRLGAPLLPTDALFSIRALSKHFRSSTTNPSALKPRAITTFFNHVAATTGIPIGAHRFRHTFATKLCNPEVGEPDIFAVQQLLGHRDLETTRKYVHSQLGRLVNQLNLLQFPAPPQVRPGKNLH